MKIILGSLLTLMALLSTTAQAATYAAGPTRAFATLQQLLDDVDLEPGDMVTVDGGVTYSGGVVVDPEDGGSAADPVVIRGLYANGARPHFRGATNTIHNRASHIVYQSIELSGTGDTATGTYRCFFHQGDNVTIRDGYIHDCPRHGILGADQDSGSLTVEYSIVMNSGSGARYHAIYTATDELAYPGSVFRLQYSYVSDSQFDPGQMGGHLIKSRSERNEIYYNWLEGAYFHELELIGPDPFGAPQGWYESLAREDSDVVGNVIVHSSSFRHILRFGGDATGQSQGRYRFVHNTVIRINGGEGTVFRLFDGLESLNASNNVFYNPGSSAMRIVREVEAEWFTGSTTIRGENNWIESGSSFIPDGFTGTISGSNPGFIDIAALDLRPGANSPLVNGGVAVPNPSGFSILSPLAQPAFEPPDSPSMVSGLPTIRHTADAPDLGALESLDPRQVFSNGFEN